MYRCLLALGCLLVAPASAAASVDYGPISHQGLKRAGAASTGLKLTLQLGLIANHSGVSERREVGQQPGVVVATASTRRCPRWPASTARRRRSVNAVVNAFKAQGEITPTSTSRTCA